MEGNSCYEMLEDLVHKLEDLGCVALSESLGNKEHEESEEELERTCFLLR